MDFDVIVLGAGIVGVSSALHLQDRGLRVALVDRRAPGEETSHGNAGLIERSSVVPYAFPRRLGTLLRYARNRSVDLYWDYRALPAYAGWLARFWRESSPQRLAAAARDLLPLVAASVVEHDALLARTDAQPLVHDGGWIEAFRSPALFDAETRAQQRVADAHGLRMTVLDAGALRAREPGIGDAFCGAFHWQDPKTVSNPGGLTKAYARLFERDGGIRARRCPDARAGRWRLAGRYRARADLGALGRGGARAVVRSRLRAARLPDSAAREARLSHALPAHARAVERARVRYRGRFRRRADGRRPPAAHHRCRDRAARRTADRRAARARRAAGARRVRHRRAARSRAVARDAALHARHAPGDRPAPRHRHLWFAFGHCHHEPRSAPQAAACSPK